jgi:hypothetical protein
VALAVIFTKTNRGVGRAELCEKQNGFCLILCLTGQTPSGALAFEIWIGQGRQLGQLAQKSLIRFFTRFFFSALR